MALLNINVYNTVYFQSNDKLILIPNYMYNNINNTKHIKFCD